MPKPTKEEIQALNNPPKDEPSVAVAEEVKPDPRAMADDEYNLQIIDDENYRVDITTLENKDPKYAYRWIRDEHKNISFKTSNALHQGGGWQLVPKSHLVKLGYDGREFSADGWYRRGDTILARMPKELFEKKQTVKQKRANAPMDAVERLINNGDSNAGQGIHITMKGIQTKDALKGNWKE